MRITFVYDVRENVLGKGDETTKELSHELFSAAQANDLVAALKELGHSIAVVDGAKSFAQQIASIQTFSDFIFNEAKGLYGPDRKMAVPALCRIHGLPFLGTGAYGLMLSRNKWHTTAIARQLGIPVPRSACVRSADEAEQLPWRIFPAFVKPNFESTSIGITDRSLAHTKLDLITQVAHVISTYRQHAIVQEYIPGYEIQTCLVGTEAPAPLGYNLLRLHDADSATRDWIRLEDWSQRLVSFEPFTNRRICERIHKWCAILYPALDLQDYGRLDFRMNLQGRLYFIESSTHPHLTHRSSFFAAAQARGYDFTGMIELLLKESTRRQGVELNRTKTPSP